MKYLSIVFVLCLFISCDSDNGGRNNEENEFDFSAIEITLDDQDLDGCWDSNETWDFDVVTTNIDQADIEWEAYLGDYSTAFPISPDGKLTPFSDVIAEYIIIASYSADFMIADTLVIATEQCDCFYTMACDQFSVGGEEVMVAPVVDGQIVLMEFSSDLSDHLGSISFPLALYPQEGEEITINLSQEDAEGTNPWSFVYVYDTNRFLTAPSNTDDGGNPIPGSSSLELIIENDGTKIRGTARGECVYSTTASDQMIMTSYMIEFIGGIFDPASDVFGCG